MTVQASFYVIEGARFRARPLLLVCKLAERCLTTGKPTSILVRDRAQAEELDALLWEFDDDAYVPHQIAGEDEDDDITPVLIVPPEIDVPARPLLINLRDEPVTGPCERVLEVVPAEPEHRGPLRQRWRHYRQLGWVLQQHTM